MLLADEPTGNLDSTSTADVLGLLEELHADGNTILLITHEHDVASRAPSASSRSSTARSRPTGTRDGGGPMNWRDVLHTAMDAVRSHRLRSALTMLGILIGITAVVLTVGIGAGARADVQDDINALGTNLLVISPGSSTSSTGVRGGFGSASTLTEQDAKALDVLRTPRPTSKPSRRSRPRRHRW